MRRREFIRSLAAGAITTLEAQAPPADFTLRIQPVTVELTPKHQIKTIGYNGTSPGPLLRVPEGKTISIDVLNDTNSDEIVHWHGLHIPSNVDGATEEGSPTIPAHGSLRYTFTAAPGGTRWYHTHVSAGRNLNRALYTGQFGFFYIEPRHEPGDYDAEFFLALKDWDPFWTAQMSDSLDVAYQRFSINDRSLGFAQPLSVKEGQRIMLRLLNASATQLRRIALPGHRFRVIALDGNPVATPQEVDALELGPAERIDALVTMNTPGVWILGAINDHDRDAGMGIVVEYAGRTGPPVWRTPSLAPWNYAAFGVSAGADSSVPAVRLPLVFRQKFVSSHWQDHWTINGKQFPHTDPIQVTKGGVYRLILDNQSAEAHPIHLHRHTFELVNVGGIETRGVRKDVVMVGAHSQVHVELIANNPGSTLFHCHNQMHMDFGFMTLLEYL
jgi:FtsP/CotA-like multicopper oxidase with cupredoxin domain